MRGHCQHQWRLVTAFELEAYNWDFINLNYFKLHVGQYIARYFFCMVLTLTLEQALKETKP